MWNRFSTVEQKSQIVSVKEGDIVSFVHIFDVVSTVRRQNQMVIFLYSQQNMTQALLRKSPTVQFQNILVLCKPSNWVPRKQTQRMEKIWLTDKQTNRLPIGKKTWRTDKQIDRLKDSLLTLWYKYSYRRWIWTIRDFIK